MQWEIMSKTDAAQTVAVWQGMGKDQFDEMVSHWSEIIQISLTSEYKKLRQEIIAAYEQAEREVSSNQKMSHKKEYFKDLIFAISLFEILKKYDFNVRLASNDQIWIYLCVKVFPDLVYKRYPGSKIKTEQGIEYKNINEERLFRTRRRIYLKVLWWYIYLSLQKDPLGKDDLDATFNVLKDNSTDEIVQIVERSGTAGYRVDVYRELMSYYSKHRDKYDNRRFRQVMVLNTARTQLVEPLLMEGGIEAYIKELFEYFDEQ